jgi:hypothetical protein
MLAYSSSARTGSTPSRVHDGAEIGASTRVFVMIPFCLCGAAMMRLKQAQPAA